MALLEKLVEAYRDNRLRQRMPREDSIP